MKFLFVTRKKYNHLLNLFNNLQDKMNEYKNNEYDKEVEWGIKIKDNGYIFVMATRVKFDWDKTLYKGI